MPSTPRTPAPERPPPPVPVSVPAPAVPPPLETSPSPSPSSQPGEEYHTPPPSLDASPREQANFPSDGRGGGTPTRSPPLHASPREEASFPSDGRRGGTPTRSQPLAASPREQASFPSDGRGGGTPTRSPPLAASPREEAILPSNTGKGWAPPKSPSSVASPREQAVLPSNGRGGGTPAKSPPREQASLPCDGRGGGGAPAKSPPLSPVHLPTPHLLPPPASSSAKNGKEGGDTAPARPPLRLSGLVRTPSQGWLATKSPSPSPTPLSPLTPAPAGNSSNKSGQSTPKHRSENSKPQLSSAVQAIAVPQFDPVEEDAKSPLHLGKEQQLDHRQQRRQQHASAAAAESGGSVPHDVAAVAAVGERRALSVTLRLATAAISLAAFAVIFSARTSGWAGDSYARHQQYRYAVAVNVIVCAYSIAQSFGEIRRLISPTFIFRSRPSYYCSLFLDQVLAYLLMSAASAAASRNDLWVSRFGTDAFNRKISSALWLSFIGFLMLALNALISTANLFSML